MAGSCELSRSVEELEGRRWPDPPADSIYMVRNVYALRKKPVGDLSVEELQRLIGQDVGLPWLVPMAIDFLRETAPREAEGGWYDEDLLSAVLTRKADLWQSLPEAAAALVETLEILKDISPYVRRDAEAFLVSQSRG
ncbi:hypothetical protein DUI70_4484 [Streptomyces albus]|uniref:contact-dependent growth inhibition system immunity protein n=1 Tax=Streptomyces physcomitrii TaxID=2724184 RepID=UPI00058F8518|nr:hypothetical protein DUI70_4484 [Streptomyces albus]